jgi:hypothetical protein
MNRRHFLQGLGAVTTSLAAALVLPTAAPACLAPKLIEVGWDTPEPAALLANLALYESRAPFDGLVLTLRNNNNQAGTWATLGYHAWHPRLERLDYYSAANNATKAVNTQAQRFKENLLDLKAQPGTNDWFDDIAWPSNFQQCKNIAMIARDTGCKGVFFDTESYSYGTPFQFAPTTTTVRDPSKSFAEYQAKVRQRGQEFMLALQAGFPGLQVLLTWGYYIALSRVTSTTPLSMGKYGLLPSFLDGMLDVATVQLYDGYEHSYGFKAASNFDGALAEFTVGYGSESAGYGQHYTPSFGLWLDCYSNTSAYRWGVNNYFSPAQWQTSLGLALAKTQKYVWVYSEQANWYDSSMPAAYQSATTAARVA